MIAWLLASIPFLPAGGELEHVLLYDEREAPSFARALATLRSRRGTFHFERADPDTVAEFLSSLSGLDFLVHPSLRVAFQEGASPPVTLEVRDLRLLAGVEHLAELGKFRFLYKHSVFLLVTPEQARPLVTLRLHDLGDLLFELRDFPAPEHLGLLLPPGTAPAQPEPPPPRTASGWKAEGIVDLVKKTAVPESWTEDIRTGVDVFGTTLVVRQTPNGQRAVERVLALLRRGG